MNTHPVLRLTLRTLLILPFAFALWYFTAEYVAEPAVWLTRKLLLGQFPSIAADVHAEGHQLVLQTKLHAMQRFGPSPRPLMFSLDTLVYTAGRPLFLALMLAAAGPRLLRRILLGMVLLTLTETFGMSFRFLAEVAQVVQQNVHVDVVRWNFIALGHQIGSLFMPTLSPLVLWAWFHFENGRIRIFARDSDAPADSGESGQNRP